MATTLKDLNIMIEEIESERDKIRLNTDTNPILHFLDLCILHVDGIALAYIIAPVECNLKGKYEHCIRMSCEFIQFIDAFRVLHNTEEVENIVQYYIEHMNSTTNKLIMSDNVI
jgi:hypothetical protein